MRASLSTFNMLSWPVRDYVRKYSDLSHSSVNVKLDGELYLKKWMVVSWRVIKAYVFPSSIWCFNQLVSSWAPLWGSGFGSTLFRAHKSSMKRSPKTEFSLAMVDKKWPFSGPLLCSSQALVPVPGWELNLAAQTGRADHKQPMRGLGHVWG